MKKLAINGGPKTRTKPFPAWPVWDEADCAAVADVVRSGQWWSGGGTKVKEFEEKFAAYQECKYGVCVPTGTIGLMIALRAVGVGFGDEVIVTPYTFIASASATTQLNAINIFVDIDPDTYNIDPAKIEEAITERTKAIMVVHIGGHPADMDAIMEIAQKRNLKVIEDCAQAHAAEWRGKRVGSFGDAGVFSFMASKNLSCGEGGIVVTNTEDVADTSWSIHNIGRVKGGGWYEHSVMGSNYRMTEFQAALLLSQMKNLDSQTAIRNDNALYLTEKLSKIDGISPLPWDDRITTYGCHLFILRYRAQEATRERFMEALKAEGVHCSPGYGPLYKEKMLSAPYDPSLATHPDFARIAEYKDLHLEHTERAAYKENVWLLQNTLLGTRKDMDDIVSAIEKIMDNIDELED
ncbi:MAG: DegT/DnrJ/EryC1/StrS family aminotransferase [Armatimonadota bacterium]|nr:DegT/DnrJ/EryC1/StrS family aminotransferase [Armatimonadota bacterium]